MKKSLLIATVLLMAWALAGCGQKEAANETATQKATDAVETVQTHDCDGGCGMTNVPMDKLTEVNGKYYCAGCAKKAQAEHDAGHGEG